MSDAGCRKGEACDQSLEHLPAHGAALLASPPEAGEPDSSHRLLESAERAVVVGHAVVAVVATQDAGVPVMLFGQGPVHQPPRLPAKRRQLARQTLALCLVLHDEPAI